MTAVVGIRVAVIAHFALGNIEDAITAVRAGAVGSTCVGIVVGVVLAVVTLLETGSFAITSSLLVNFPRSRD